MKMSGRQVISGCIFPYALIILVVKCGETKYKFKKVFLPRGKLARFILVHFLRLFRMQYKPIACMVCAMDHFFLFQYIRKKVIR